MRRQDRELTDQDLIDSILEEETVCRVGMFDGVYPYIVPLHFVYDRKTKRIYFHSAAEGKKIEILKKQPEICIEIDRVYGIIRAENPCSASTSYISVIGFGTASVCIDKQEISGILGKFTEKYLGETRQFTVKESASVTIFRIQLTEITAKRNIREK